jgi:hypothetical protein
VDVTSPLDCSMLGGARLYSQPVNADNITMDDILMSCPFGVNAELSIDCGRWGAHANRACLLRPRLPLCLCCWFWLD